MLSYPFIFASSLFLLWWSSFNLLAIVGFLFVNFLLYIYPLLNSLVFLGSFLIFILLSISSLIFIGNYFPLLVLAIIIFYLFFYIIMGLKNLYLTNREYWYYMWSLFLFYLLLCNFFIKVDSYVQVKLAILIIAIFFLWKEFLKIITKKISRENNLSALFFSILIGELAWIISWLPISFLAQVNSLFFIVYIMGIAILNKGKLVRI